MRRSLTVESIVLMVVRYLFSGWIILFFVQTIVAQNRESVTLQTIQFNGLKRTQAAFLTQYIQTEKGATLNDSLVQADVQRLKNIAGIGNATAKLDTLSKGIRLTFQIEEVRTLLPILNFGGIEGNVWFQVGFSDINWQGKGQFLSAAYQNNDRRHSGNIYYKVPRINGTNWGFTASLNKWSSREPLFFDEGTVNYDYDNNGIGLTAIRHFSFLKYLEVGGTYFVEEYVQSNLQFLENPPGPVEFRQPKWLSKFSYSENYLNYHKFYLQGLYWQAILQDVFNTIDRTWFHSFLIQAKYFKRIGQNGNLAARTRFGIATNNDSPFAPFVVDSHVNIRGVGNRIDRGTAQIILNTEYRHTLFETQKFGAQVVGFSDAGTWRNPGGELKDLFDKQQFRVFVGGGFRLIYNKIYGAVLRIDYGIDIFNKQQRGFVIGLGQYF